MYSTREDQVKINNRDQAATGPTHSNFLSTERMEFNNNNNKHLSKWSSRRTEEDSSSIKAADNNSTRGLRYYFKSIQYIMLI